MEAWLPGLLECTRAWECNQKLNNQPVCERVTASNYYIHPNYFRPFYADENIFTMKKANYGS